MYNHLPVIYILDVWVQVGSSGTFSSRASHTLTLDSVTGVGYLVAGAYYAGTDDYLDGIYEDVWSIQFRGMCIFVYFNFNCVIFRLRLLIICIVA